MKGCLRAAVTVTGLALIGLALGAILLAVQANTWLRSPAEAALTAILGAPCRVEALHVRPLAHCLEARGIALATGTPESGMSLKADSLVLTPDLGTLLTRTPTLRRCVVKGTRIEMRVGSATDLGLLFLGAWGAGKRPSQPTSEATKWAVREFACDGVRLGGPNAMDDVVVPPFEIGSTGSPPIPPGELARLFIRTVVRRAVEAEGKSNPLTTLLGASLGVEPDVAQPSAP